MIHGGLQRNTKQGLRYIASSPEHFQRTLAVGSGRLQRTLDWMEFHTSSTVFTAFDYVRDADERVHEVHLSKFVGDALDVNDAAASINAKQSGLWSHEGQVSLVLVQQSHVITVMTPQLDRHHGIFDCLQVLYQFCNQTLNSKPTTIKQDRIELKKLKQGDKRDERKRLAIQFRIGKKLILQSCIRRHTEENRIHRL